eukprot:gnl/MRDRNA2_/MRDRNA2_106403_c0_seq1.p1 gnl/MRDRNA2_/MRDRNA2_106403_c0~~gnl/MRDRNA2_/MRDRNA2_106403_c0_seq1.p1  ORF type:complete len:418 (+),score=62.66 gnl/MRDRNA2_/MRDRNA2_106403_c0_seq1:179-1432(+)
MSAHWLRKCVFFMFFLAAKGVRRQSVRGSKVNSTSMPPFFHTTEALHSELKQLATRCPGMSFRTESKGSLIGVGSTSIDVISIKSKSSKPTNRMFMLFGEHARELISPETGLHLIKTLCGETSLSSLAVDALADTEFQIVVNGNPKSRMRVEQGDFCLRVNPNGVDLNRNWNEHWSPEPSEINAVDTNPGPAPFSEPETQIFKKLVTDFDPTVFLTVHSGTRGMYMPWAYNQHSLGKQNQAQMLQLLVELDSKYCQCPYGGAGKEVGYPCPGTCLDWIYDELKTPYAFAFEIYAHPANDQQLRARWEEKKKNPDALLQSNDAFEHVSQNAQPQQCFYMFNPTKKEEYDQELKNWVSAYLDMAIRTAAEFKAGKVDLGSNTTAPVPMQYANQTTVLFKHKVDSARLPYGISFPLTGLE